LPTGLVLALATLAISSVAAATPNPNSAVLHLRVFNDCPISVLTTSNLFPASITISDQNQPPQPLCAGFANLHTWRFSQDGVNAIQFQNGDAFQYEFDFLLNGAGEGGLSLSPWFSPDADGLFNVRTTDGEIAVFGGRLPFFSFTGAFGLLYTNNTPIHLAVSYNPRGLSAASPAQVVYTVVYGGNTYTSGPLNFDQGNPAEDPPHGQWGALTPWYAGGHVKMFVFPAGQPHGVAAQWNNIQWNTEPTALALSPAHLWIGLRNSDDQGTQFDLRTEVLKNSVVVASGLTRCITGVTRNPSFAKEVIVPFGAFPPVSLASGDVLSLRVSTRIGTNPDDTKCSGPGGSHNNATGLRLYYDSTGRPSRFDATIPPNANEDLYLHSDGGLCPGGGGDSPGVTTRYLSSTAPTNTSPKCKDSTGVNFNFGNPFREIGTWSLP
jgi:hypothetical protein